MLFHNVMMVAPNLTTAIKLAPSSFLQLPAEIRNLVYEKLYEGVEDKVVNIIRSNSGVLQRPAVLLADRKGLRSPETAIRLTCRQVCKEVTPYIFEGCSFGIFLRNADRKRHDHVHVGNEIADFSSLFGPKLQFIRHLELGLDDLRLFIEGFASINPTQDEQPTGLRRLPSHVAASSDRKDSGVPGLRTAIEMLPTSLLSNVRIVTLHTSREDSPTTATSRQQAEERFLATAEALATLIVRLVSLYQLRIVDACPAGPLTECYEIDACEGGREARLVSWYDRTEAFSYAMTPRLVDENGVQLFDLKVSRPQW